MRQVRHRTADATRKGVAVFVVGALAILLALAGLSACTNTGKSAGARKTLATPSPLAFDHYRNARYDYRLDYPADFIAQRVAANGDGRVIRSNDVALRVFGVPRQGRSLRALALDEIADPSAASDIQNSAGRVVLVQDDARQARTVKTIALSGERAAVLVVDGRMTNARQRRRVLDSFQPASLRAADRGEAGTTRRYRNPALGFSIERPEGARVARDGDDSVSFAVLGPENEAASEISDGFTLTVVRDSEHSAPTLNAYAEAMRADGAPAADRVRVGAQTALRYTNRSELGDTVTHWLFKPDNGARYEVSASVSGPARDYRKQIDAMLASLRFTPPR